MFVAAARESRAESMAGRALLPSYREERPGTSLVMTELPPTLLLDVYSVVVWC